MGFGDAWAVRRRDGSEGVAIRNTGATYPVSASFADGSEDEFTFNGRCDLVNPQPSKDIIEVIQKLDWRPAPTGDSNVSGNVDLSGLKFGDVVMVRRRDGLVGPAIRTSDDEYPVSAMFSNGQKDSYRNDGHVLDSSLRAQDIVAIIAEPPVPAEPWKHKFVRIGNCEVIERFGKTILVGPTGSVSTWGGWPSWLTNTQSWSTGESSNSPQSVRCQQVLEDAAKEQARIDAESAANAEQTARAEAEKLFQWVEFKGDGYVLNAAQVDTTCYQVNAKGSRIWIRVNGSWTNDYDTIESAKSACVDHYLRRAK